MLPFKERPLFPGNELHKIQEFLAEEGISQAKMFMGTGLSEACLTNPDVLLSWEQFDIIYRNIFRLSKHPHSGLLLGKTLDITRWGVLGLAMSSARDIDQALGVANYYRHLVRSPFNYSISRTHNGLLVKLIKSAQIESSLSLSFVTEVFMAGTQSIIEDLLGKPFHFREAGFVYSAPEYSSAYNQILACPVKFNCNETYYIIDDSGLRTHLPKSNPINYNIARQLCEEKRVKIQSCMHGDIVVQVQEQLARHEGSTISLEVVAEKMGVSTRTVRRKLQEKGTSFRDLSNQDRKRKALDYLHNSTLSSESIAALLGFSDTASFRKAFKRWIGMNPKEYQENLNNNKEIRSQLLSVSAETSLSETNQARH